MAWLEHCQSKSDKCQTQTDIDRCRLKTEFWLRSLPCIILIIEELGKNMGSASVHMPAGLAVGTMDKVNIGNGN
jgi:hypothetical protein